MALIECPECKKEISNLASSCPRCGYPIARKFRPINIEEKIDLVRKETSATNKILHPTPLLIKIDSSANQRVWTPEQALDSKGSSLRSHFDPAAELRGIL